MKIGISGGLNIYHSHIPCYHYSVKGINDRSIQFSWLFWVRVCRQCVCSTCNHQGASCAHTCAVWRWLKALLLRTQSSHQPCMCSHKHFNWCKIYKHGPKKRGTWNMLKKKKCKKKEEKCWKPCEHSFHLTPNNLLITRGKLTVDINQNEMSINNISWKPQSASNTLKYKHSKKIFLHIDRNKINSYRSNRNNTSVLMATKSERVMAIHDSCVQRWWEMGEDSQLLHQELCDDISCPALFQRYHLYNFQARSRTKHHITYANNMKMSRIRVDWI